jgi:hypothetical protein
MSHSLPPEVSRSLETQAKNLQSVRKTLDINPPALERLVSFSMDAMALLLAEADAIARGRRGDDIQSGDVELAQRRLQGRTSGNYWAVAIGSAFAGAGAQGLVDAILSSKGKAFIIVYSVAILLGLFGLYRGAPRS